LALAGAVHLPACLKKGPPAEKEKKEDDSYEPLALPRRRADGGAADAKQRSARKGGKAVVHLGYEPPHLNLFVQEDYWISRIVINNIQEALVRVDTDTGRIMPNLATRWEVDESGKEVTFWLRNGVRFHDGKPLSAEDVIFTLDVLADPHRSNASLRQDLEQLESWKAEGRKVVLRLKRPDFKLLSSLAHLPILPKHVYAASDFKTHPANHSPVGTGPFRFVRWKRGTSLKLARWQGYWGDEARLNELVFRVVRDKNKALALLRRGELQLIPQLPLNQVCKKGSPIRNESFQRRFKVSTHYPNQFHSIILNTATPQLADREVREALVYLTDRKLLARKLLCRHARIISGPFWPERPGYDSSVKPRVHSLEKAKDLLAKAGWKDVDGDGVREKKGKELELVYLQIAESSLQRRLCPILEQAYEKAGVRLVIKRVPFSRWLQLVRKHSFHLADVVWTFYGEQDLYQHYHCSQREGGSNYGSYCNEKADALLEKIRRTLDDSDRHALERKLHRLLHRDLPAVYLFNTARVAVSSRRLKGAEPTNEGFIWSKLWLAPRRDR
jgi:ABC-type transport system substrate-binding protein